MSIFDVINLVQMTDVSNVEETRSFGDHHSSFAYRYTSAHPKTSIDISEPVDISELETSYCQHRGYLNVLTSAQMDGWTHAILPVYTKKDTNPSASYGTRIMTDVQTAVTERVKSSDVTLVMTAQRGLAEELGCCAKHIKNVNTTSFVAYGLRPFVPTVDKFRGGVETGRSIQVLPVGRYDELFTLISLIDARSATSSAKELQNISMICIMPLDVLADRARSIGR